MTSPCPICRKAQAVQLYQPFCSRRCADVDLNRWFSGVYAVPAAQDEESSSLPDEQAGDAGQGRAPNL